MYPIPLPKTDEIAALLFPGKHPEGVKGGELRQCGKCDGVIWLGRGVEEVRTKREGMEDLVTQRLVSGKNEALRWLRPMPESWHAKRAILGEGLALGVCMPAHIAWIFPSEAVRLSKELGREIEYLFVTEDHCINLVRYEHGEDRQRWKVYQVAADVWAVVFV